MDNSFLIFKRPTLVLMLFKANISSHVKNNDVEFFNAKKHEGGQVSCLWAERGCRTISVVFLSASQVTKLTKLNAI